MINSILKQINTKQLIKRNLPILQNWLSANCASDPNFAGEIGLNKDGKVVLDPLPIISDGIYPYGNIFAIMRLDTPKQDLSISAWANAILSDYAKWYNKQYLLQKQMTALEVANLLAHYPKSAVFSAEEYQTFILNNLSHLNANEVDFNYLLDKQKFLRQIAIRYNNYAQIHSSLFFRLIQLLALQDNKSFKVTKNKLQSVFYQTLISENGKFPKIIFDVNNSVPWLINDLDDLSDALTILLSDKKVNTTVNLPITKLLLNPKVTTFCNLQYDCKCQHEIDLLINILLLLINSKSNEKVKATFYQVMQNKQIAISLGKWQSYLIKQTNILATDFANVEILVDLTKMLQAIIDKARN